jgi:CARDB
MKQLISKLAIVLALVMVMGLFSGYSTLSAKGLPDLKVINIFTTRDCKLAVTVMNAGPGNLPMYVYTKHHPKSAGVYVYINGKKWGGQTIWKFDSAKRLIRPGGKATAILNYKVNKPLKVKAVVDMHNDVKERNERNNTMKKGVRCQGGGGFQVKLPDLIVRDIRLVQGCKIEITVKNIGSAGVPASFYNLPKAVAVQLYNGGKPWGGIILSGFDKAGKLKSPGGVAKHIWFPKAANLNLSAGTHSLKAIVDFHKVLTEKKENNNSLTKRVTCKPFLVANPVVAQIPGRLVVKAPQRFFVDFKDAYLAYKISTKSIQVIAESNVLSYGSDWEKCQLKPYLFHIRQKVWKGFYWEINTSRKEVYKVTGGSFCKLDGTKTRMAAKVDVRGGFFYLRFPQAYLVYVPSTKVLQIATEQMVLSYATDWKKCNLSTTIYQLKENFWSSFFWQINTITKKAIRVKGKPFCKTAGKGQQLKATVRVVN